MSQMQAGQMMGPYRLINEIGKGGMATVWKAYHAAMDRYVAIKMLPYQFAQREEFLARFRQEARVIAKLEHPHILPVYDYGESDDMPYLVMRLLDAGTLTERIQAGALSLTEVDRIFTQLAEALEYAHEKGVIHRDIKPSNAMLDQRGEIFLTDFGIAKIVESAVQLTSTGTITGTPEYMSPEQAQGMKVDHRSDIYSLGVVLYEMLTGQVPYHAETPIAVILMKIQNPLPPPSVVNPEIPDPLEPVLLKALTKEPRDRFSTMNEFLAAWKKAVAECTPTAEIRQATVLAAEKKRAGDEGSQSKEIPVGVRKPPVAQDRRELPAEKVGIKPEKAQAQAQKGKSFPWVWILGGAGALAVGCGLLFGGTILLRAIRTRNALTPTQYVMAAAPRPTETLDAFPTQAAAGSMDLPTETQAAVLASPLTDTPAPTSKPQPSHTPAPIGLPPQMVDPKGLQMVLVPEGAFEMGSNLDAVMPFCPDWDQGRQCLAKNYIGEAGVHTVALDAYYIDQYEVTNQAYALCVKTGDCEAPADISLGTQDYYYNNPKFDNYPVVNVTWNEAMKYCNWRGGRLPTEAEWEKAARGTDQRLFPWGNAYTSTKANLCDINCTAQQSNKDLNDGYPYTSPVGIFLDAQSPYGAYDMAGNVWEWVIDWYDEGYYGTQLAGSQNPQGPDSGDGRVVRGGSWVSNIFNARTTLRLNYQPDQHAFHIGFRCVREP
jgi:formylglycine-generating enzyme required for sulfatase activity